MVLPYIIQLCKHIQSYHSVSNNIKRFYARWAYNQVIKRTKDFETIIYYKIITTNYVVKIKIWGIIYQIM